MSRMVLFSPYFELYFLLQLVIKTSSQNKVLPAHLITADLLQDLTRYTSRRNDFGMVSIESHVMGESCDLLNEGYGHVRTTTRPILVT